MHALDPSSTRRHDLDWLRVGAFLLLIVYHIGMFYVPWGWHVKSAHAPVTAFETPMRLMNTWRLPLLFFISGVALWFACQKNGLPKLARRRLMIIGIPLLFGMYVICAPQAWHELRQAGIFEGNVRAFYAQYINWPWASPPEWPIITPTWNHLWYLLYVLAYALVLIAAYAAFPNKIERLSNWFSQSVVTFALLPGVHITLLVLLQDSLGEAQTLWGDWYNLTASFWVMATGFLLARGQMFWDRLRAARWIFLVLALVFSVGIARRAGQGVALFGDLQAYDLLRILHGWIVIWMLLGWGQVLLKVRNPLLTYLSGAVFTYYVLHQTIIIMVGVPLSGLDLPLVVEVLVLTASTAVLCWAGYHLLARRMGRWGILLGARTEG